MNRKTRKIFTALISLPKTIYFNFRVFGNKGYRLPIFVSYDTKLTEIHKGVIEIPRSSRLFGITIGYGGSDGIIPNRYSEICLSKHSKLIFRGDAQFAAGCSIRNDGVIDLGNNFSMNKNSFLSCLEKIEIGDEVTAGWNVTIRDSDGHYVIHKGVKKTLFAPVKIGRLVWLCSYTDILKGVVVGNNCVVAYRSLVTKPFPENNIMIGGSPAKIIQDEIDWEY